MNVLEDKLISDVGRFRHVLLWLPVKTNPLTRNSVKASFDRTHGWRLGMSFFKSF
ncbi:MAG: hypothetical protein QXH32_08455 [Candidatus Caldarchaeum sp.]